MAVPGLSWSPLNPDEIRGHVTVVTFWGSTERGALAVSIKHVSVWGGGGPTFSPKVYILTGHPKN